jgi:topoisomerase IA-like protein
MNAPKQTGLPVERKSGRFGPYIQLGEGKDAKRASIPKDVDLRRPEQIGGYICTRDSWSRR